MACSSSSAAVTCDQGQHPSADFPLLGEGPPVPLILEVPAWVQYIHRVTITIGIPLSLSSADQTYQTERVTLIEKER